MKLLAAAFAAAFLLMPAGVAGQNAGGEMAIPPTPMI